MRTTDLCFGTGLSLVLLVLALGILAPAHTFAISNKGQAILAPTALNAHLPINTISSPVQGTISAHTGPQSVMADQNQLFHLFPRKGTTAEALASPSQGSVTYNGGSTMHTSITYTIFWLPKGASFEPSVGNDSSYQKLIIRLLNDTGGTSFYNILSQYPDSTNGTPLDSSTFGGSYVDTTAYPASGTKSHPLFDTDIQAEVTRALSATGWMPSPNKIFFVFTGYGIESCRDASDCTFPTSTSSGYCAYHSYFLKNSQPVIYANMPDFAYPSQGCTPNYSPPNGDYYADPEINLVSHEFFEAVSDPQLSSWYDSSGLEIGDKCAWTFGTVNPDGSNVLLNGHKYLVQEEWSNYDGNCVLTYGTPYSVSVSLASSSGTTPVNSTNSLRISYASKGSSWWTSTAYTNGSLTIDTDQNTPVTVSGGSSASNQRERWCLNRQCSSVSFNAGNGTAAAYYYYDLLAQQASFSVIGGGTPSILLNLTSAPLSQGSMDTPENSSIMLTLTSQTISVLRGTIVSIPSVVDGVQGERWVTSVMTWLVSQVSQIPNPILYYHQYQISLDLGAVSSLYSITSPPVSGDIYWYNSGSPVLLILSGAWGESLGTRNRLVSYALNGGAPTPVDTAGLVTVLSLPAIASPQSITTETARQYLLTLTVPAGSVTSVSPSPTADNWYDSGSILSIVLNGVWNVVNGQSRERLTGYAFDGTLSVVESGSGSFPVKISMNNSHSFVATSIIQYHLDLSGGGTIAYSTPSPTGDDWFDSRTAIFVSSNYAWGLAGGQSRNNLVSYTLDGNIITVPRSGSGVFTSQSILFASSHSIRFNSLLQYFLTDNLSPNSVSYLTSSPTGDSWYDNETIVSIVLNKVWDVTQDQSRENLVSYTIDSVTTMVARTSSGVVAIPSIQMNSPHAMLESSVTQYYISVTGATVSGSQTGDGWFDSGSLFTVEATYSRAYVASVSYRVYVVSAGFQILANTTVSSVLWTNSSGTLEFKASHADLTVYIPTGLNLVPTKVLDDGSPLSFSYSTATGLLSFRGSSSFQIDLVPPSRGSSPGFREWGFYLAASGVVLASGIISVLALRGLRKRVRRTPSVPERTI